MFRFFLLYRRQSHYGILFTVFILRLLFPATPLCALPFTVVYTM